MHSVEGVIIGAKNFGEADKIFDIFTREQGLIKAMAFGCRRPRSPLAGSLQLFSHAELQLTAGKRIDTIRHAGKLSRFKGISEDLTVLAYATFMAELVREFFPEGESDEEFFVKLLQIFRSFTIRNPRVTALIGVLQLLKSIGLQLSFERCVHCGKAAASGAAFKPDTGGALCKDCVNLEEVLHAFDYPSELQEFFVALEKYDFNESASLTVKGGVLMKAEKIILNYILSLVENPLQSLKVINQLG